MAVNRILSVRITDDSDPPRVATTEILVTVVPQSGYVPPAVAIGSPLAGATVSGTIQLSGTYTVDSRLEPRSIRAKIGNGAWVTMAFNLLARTWTGSYTLSGVTLGTQTLTAELTDTYFEVATATRSVQVE